MNKKTYAFLGLVVVIVVAGVIFFTLRGSETKGAESVAAGAAVSSPPQTTPQESSETPSGQTVTKVGTIECLTPSDTSGPQQTSCALGLQQDDGTSFGLNAANPQTIGSLPTGQRVQVTGTLTQQTTQYKISGIINVASVQRL